MTHIEQQTFKITWIKAGSVLVTGFGICISIGILIGEVKGWKKDVDDNLQEYKKSIEENTHDISDLKEWKKEAPLIFVMRETQKKKIK